MNKFLGAIFSSVFLLTAVHADETCNEEATCECDMMMIDYVDVHDAQAEMLLNIMEGKTQNLALHFAEGTSIPLHTKIKGEFLEFDSNDANLSINIKKDFYLRVEGKNILLSSNLKTWEPVKQFATGNLFAGLIKDDVNPVYLLLEAELNERS